MTKGFCVTWTKKAVKELKKLPHKQQVLIFEWVDKTLECCTNPKSIQSIKKIQGTQNG